MKSGKMVIAFLMTLLMIAPILVPAYASNTEIIPVPPPGGKEDQVNRYKAAEINPGALKNIVPKLSPKLLDKEYLATLVGEKLKSIEASTGVNEPGLIVVLGIDDFQSKVDELRSVIEKYGKNVAIAKTWSKLGMAFVKIDSDNPEYILRIAVDIAKEDYVDFVDVNDVAQISLFDSHALLDTFTTYNTLGLNGSGVTVAVLDTGIEEAHPELSGSVIAWADFINNEPDPYDDHGHGTFVAGIIAARGVSPWLNGEGLWHSVNYNDASEFNYPGIANLTYGIDVTGYGGSTVTLNFTHRYWIEDGFDYGYVYYWTDVDPTPTLLADYTGDGFDPLTESFNITLDPGVAMLYISFQYDPDSSIQYYGWWLDDIMVYNASDPTDVIFYDDVEGPAPPEVIESYLWSRTTTRLQGMAPDASLIGVKVCSAAGGCPGTAILDGIEYAINESADIISMSLGGPVSGYDSMMMAIDTATYVYGITCVISAGNEGPGYYTVGSPAAAQGAIAVGAATKTNTIAGFSSWGPNPVNFDIKPDITAYGRYVISTMAAEPYGYPPGTYRTAIGSGTSFSAPMISGLVALIKQAHPDWTPEMIRSALISTAMMDLDESSVTDPYVMNPYIQGGGIPNITAAITTPFLPIPAKVSFGLVDPNGTGVTVWRTVDLIALSPSVSTATVLSVELYDVYGNDYSSWITSPSVGDTFTLNSTLNLSISVPATAPGDRLYWGRILLDVNPTYQVIFGFYVPTKYWLNGTVYDVSTFDPVPGALVMAVSPDLSIVYNSTYTDASGQFSMQVYSRLDVRVEVSMPGYYEYYSLPFTMDGDVVWDAYITPIVGYDPLNMLVVWDNVYGFWTGDPYTTNIGDVLSLDGTLGVTMFLWDNDLQQVAADAILSGDFPVVGMFSGGVWYPFADILDAIALWYYALYYDGGILLEGGDIGWFWSGTPIMTDVAHAEFVGDLWPSTYTIEVTRDHAVTRFLPSTTIDIDSSGEGWPDAVVPVNGGVDVANWSFGYSAIVTYDSRPDGISTGESRTVYYAFPWDSILDSTTKYTLLNYTILWLFDRGPPVYTGTNVTVDIDVAAGTAVARWDPFADEPFGIVTFNVYLNGTLLASGLTGNSFDLTPYVAPGERYIVTVEAVDVVGDSTNISAWFYMIPPG
ncbi:MAG: S8 family serine peptidase, partial [Desulfurococcales archaeon]|nr:S8 family serine peptidase [Desulfurococcales archaeon]